MLVLLDQVMALMKQCAIEGDQPLLMVLVRSCSLWALRDLRADQNEHDDCQTLVPN